VALLSSECLQNIATAAGDKKLQLPTGMSLAKAGACLGCQFRKKPAAVTRREFSSEIALNAEPPVSFFSVAILESEPHRFDETANVWIVAA
jgi:hypothetical protein